MNFYKISADSYHPGGLGTRMRMKRHAIFIKLIQTLPEPISILDVGGTELYWRSMGIPTSPRFQITLLNLEKETVTSADMVSIVGDATNMRELEDQSFDVVFSNSVIEHVGNFEAQTRMAKEVTRIGKRYFIQTPSYWFPIEPHFLFPGFQWLPKSLRVWLVMRFSLGWYRRTPDFEQARDLVDHHRLLTGKELRSLFPKAKLYEEKIFGLTKSFISYGGWD